MKGVRMCMCFYLPVARVCPFSLGPCPTVTPRKCLSHTSSTRCQVMVEGSMSRRAKARIS